MADRGYDGTIKIDSKVDKKGFDKGVKEIEKSSQSLTQTMMKLGKVIAATFAVAAVVAFAKASIDAASQLSSALIGLKSVLDGTGKSFDEAKAFIDSYIKDGLIPATDAITAYKNLALRGYSTEQIQKTLTMLKDSAAFGRQSSLSIGEAVKGATEGLKNENSILVDNAGVTKNVAKMWQDYADKLGIATTSMTKAQKIEAELAGITEETRFQTGDAAKAAGTYAGQMSALGVSILNLKVAVGEGLMPIVQAIIPTIRRVVDWLTLMAQKFALFMKLLFGVKTDSTETASGLGDAADNAGELNDNLKKTAKTAKGALASFDELNVLTKSTAENTDTVAPPGDKVGSGGIKLTNLDESSVDKITEMVKNFKDTLSKILNPALETAQRILEAIKPYAEWFWTNFLVPLGEWTGGVIADILERVQVVFADLGEWIETHPDDFQNFLIILGSFAAAWLLVTIAMGAYSLIMGIATTATGIFGTVLAIATSPVTLIILAIGALIAIVILLIKYWPEITAKAQEAWAQIKETWAKVSAWFSEHVVEPVKEFFAHLGENISGFFSGAWAVIALVWENVSTWFHDKVIEPVKEWFRTAWDNISGFFTGAWEVIKLVWNTVGEWFRTNVTDPVKEWFRTAGENISGFFTGAWETIKGGWETAVNWFQTTIIDPIGNAFHDMLYGADGQGGIIGWFRGVFDSIGEIAKGGVNILIMFLNNMISSVVDGINGLINAANVVGNILPGFQPIQFLTAPQIPYLAKGAVIPPNAQFMAMLGDQRNGKNIEAPEALIRQIVQEETTAIVADQNININFGGGMSDLIRILQPEISKENSRIGRSLVTGVR